MSEYTVQDYSELKQLFDKFNVNPAQVKPVWENEDGGYYSLVVFDNNDNIVDIFFDGKSKSELNKDLTEIGVAL